MCFLHICNREGSLILNGCHLVDYKVIFAWKTTYIMKAGHLKTQSKQVDRSYNHWNNKQGFYQNIITNPPNGDDSK